MSSPETLLDLDGWLFKQGEKGLIKGFKKRWFCFRHGKLYYFEKEASNVKPQIENALGFVDLELCTDIRDPAPLVFHVVVPGRVFILKGDTEATKVRWLRGLRKYVELRDANPLLDEAERLRKHQAKLEAELASQGKMVDVLSRRLSTRDFDSKNVSAELEDAKDEIECLRQEIAVSRAENEVLAAKLAESEKAVTTEKVAVDAISTRLEELNGELVLSENSSGELRHSLKLAQEAHGSTEALHRARVEQLEVQLASAHKEGHAQLQELSTQLKEAQEKVAGLTETHAEQLKAADEVAKARMAELTKEKDQQVKAATDMVADLNKQLESVREGGNESIKELSAKLGEAKEENSKREAAFQEQLAAQQQTLAAAKAEFQEELEDVNEQLNAAQTASMELKHQLEMSAVKSGQLEERVGDLSRQLESAQAGGDSQIQEMTAQLRAAEARVTSLSASVATEKEAAAAGQSKFLEEIRELNSQLKKASQSAESNTSAAAQSLKEAEEEAEELATRVAELNRQLSDTLAKQGDANQIVERISAEAAALRDQLALTQQNGAAVEATLNQAVQAAKETTVALTSQLKEAQDAQAKEQSLREETDRQSNEAREKAASEIAALTAELTSAQEAASGQIGALTLELQQATGALEAQSLESASALAEVQQEFQGELEDLQAKSAALSSQLEAAQKGGSAQVEELSSQLKAAQDSLEQEKSSRAASLAEAQERLIDSQQEGSTRVQELTNQLLAAQHQVQASQADRSGQLEELRDELRAQEEAHKTQVEALRASLHEEKSAATSLSSKLEDLRLAGEQLDARLVETSELLAVRDRELTAAHSRVGWTAELESLQSSVQDAEQESSVVAQQVTALENDLRTRDAKVKELQDETQRLQASLTQIQEEKQSAEKKAVSGSDLSNQQIAELKLVIEQLRSENQELHSKMKDGDAHVSVLKLEATVRGRANSVIATQAEKLAQEKEALERELEKLSPRPKKANPAKMRRSKSGNWTGAIRSAEVVADPRSNKPKQGQHTRRRSLRMGEARGSSLLEELEQPSSAQQTASGGSCEQCLKEHSTTKCAAFVAHAFIANSCKICYHPLALHTGPVSETQQADEEQETPTAPKKMDISSLEKNMRESQRLVKPQEPVGPAKKIDIAQREKEIWDQTQVKKIDRELKAPKKLDVAVMAQAESPEQFQPKSPRSYAYQQKQKAQKTPRLKSDMSLADLRVIITRGDEAEFTAELLGKCATMIEEREAVIEIRDEQRADMQGQIDALTKENSLLEVGVRQHKARTQIIDGLGGNALQNAQQKASQLEVELNGKLAMLKQLRKKLDTVKGTIDEHEARANEAEKKIQGVIDSTNAEKQTLKAQVAEKNKSIVEIKVERDELAAQVFALESHVEELTTEQTIAKVKMDQLELQKQSLSNQSSGLTSALEAGTLELSRVSNLYEEEKTQHSALKTESQQKLTKLQTEKMELQEAVAKLENDLTTSQQSVTGLTSQLEACEKGGSAQIEELQSQLKAAQEVAGKEKADGLTALAEAQQAHKEVAELLEAELSKILSQLETSQKESTDQLDQLKSELEGTKGLLEEARQNSETMSNDLGVVTGQKEEIDVLANMLQTEKDELQAKYEVLQGEKDGLLTQHTALQTEKEELLAKYTALVAEKQNLEDASSQGDKEMSARLSDKENQISALNSQLSNLTSENQELKEELEDLRITEKRLTQAASSSNEQITELEEHIEDLGEEKTRLETAMLEKQRELNTITAELNENQTEIIALMKQVAEMRPQAEIDAKERKTARQFESALVASEQESHRMAMDCADLQEETGKLQDMVNQLRADVFRKEQELKAQRGEIRKRTASVVTHTKSVAHMIEQTEMVQQRNVFLTNELLRLESEFHAKLVAKEKTMGFLSGALWDMREKMQTYRRIVFYGEGEPPPGEPAPEIEIATLRQQLFFAKAVAIKMRWLMKGISVNADVAELYETGKSLPAGQWDGFLELQIKPKH